MEMQEIVNTLRINKVSLIGTYLDLMSCYSMKKI